MLLKKLNFFFQKKKNLRKLAQRKFIRARSPFDLECLFRLYENIRFSSNQFKWLEWDLKCFSSDQIGQNGFKIS